MIEEALNQVRGNRWGGILVDSNLLLLWLVGSIDTRAITRCNRTSSYGEADFDLVDRLIRAARRAFTTPHVATEVSNLSGKLSGVSTEELRRRLSNYIEDAQESTKPANEICESPFYRELGIADAALTMLGQRRRIVLTDDFDLARSIERLGGRVINYNNLRPYLL